MTDRRGFTLIELLVVVLIVGIVAAIALPQLNQLIVIARAADIVSQLEAIRLDTHMHQTDKLEWPKKTGKGGVPSDLVPYLPDNFSFDAGVYDLTFENWGGSPYTVGVTVDTDETPLGLYLFDMLSSPKWNSGSKYTWVIE